MSAALPGPRDFMEWAGDQGSDPITRPALEEQVPDKIRLLDQMEETCTLASRASLTVRRGVSHRIFPKVKDWKPTVGSVSGSTSSTAGCRRNIVSMLLNPEKVKLDDLGAAIETWEEKIRAYEQRRGPDGERKEMDDDIKSGALQSMCPESLQTHLSMNSKRLKDYA